MTGKNILYIFFILEQTCKASYLNLSRTSFLESRLVNSGEMTHEKTSALTGYNCFSPSWTSAGLIETIVAGEGTSGEG